MSILSNVNGKFAVDSTGAIQFSGQTGTSGYVLKSNGNAAPTWVDGSTVIGGPYLPLSGGILTGATATASGISFTVGGVLTGTSATFSGDVSVEDNLYLTDAGTVRGKIQLNSSDRDDLDIKVVSLGSNIKFFTVDSERMRIDSSGNLLIGITTASATLGSFAQLEVSDSTKGGIIINTQTAGASNYSRLMFSINNNINGHEGLIRYNTSDYHMSLWTDGSEKMRITSGGNVGIGLTSPGAKLDVLQEARVSFANSNQYTLRITNTDGNPRILADGSAAHLIFGTTPSGSATATERMIIQNSGNVGIGTTSPTKKLTVDAGTTSGGGINIRGSSSPAIYIDETSGVVNSSFQNDGAGSYLGTSTSHPMIFRTVNTERMRIKSGGEVGIGRSALLNNALTVTKTDANSNFYETLAAIEICNSNANAGKWRALNFKVGAGNYSETLGGIYCQYEAFSTNVTGNMVFATRAANSVNPTEKMRISPIGTLTFTADSPNGSNGIFYNNSSTTPYGIACSLPNGSSDTTRYLFFGDCAGSSKFKVSTSGQIYAVSTSIASISDVRFKENIRDIDTGLEEILNLKPRLFDWKENKGKNEKDSVGFIAQEVEKVLPKLVQENWSDNGIDKDGKVIEGEKYKTVSQADMIPTLVKAIQELKAEIEILKNK